MAVKASHPFIYGRGGMRLTLAPYHSARRALRTAPGHAPANSERCQEPVFPGVGVMAPGVLSWHVLERAECGVRVVRT